MKTLHFNKPIVYYSANVLIVLLICFNFYLLCIGSVLAMIPLTLQCTFLILFCNNHKWYRKLGLILFLLFAISGLFGCIAIMLKGLHSLLTPDAADGSALQTALMIRHTVTLIAGSIFFYALKKTSPRHSLQLSRVLSGWKNVSLLHAIKSAFIIRLGLVAFYFCLGIVIGLLGFVSAGALDIPINVSEHAFMLIGVILFTLRSGKNIVSQAILISLMNWLFLLPFALYRIEFWVMGIYLFIFEALISITFISVYRRLRAYPSITLSLPAPMDIVPPSPFTNRMYK